MNNKELPSIDEFIGSDPDFTGDMSTKEYVQRIREYSEKHPKPPYPEDYNMIYYLGKYISRAIEKLALAIVIHGMLLFIAITLYLVFR